VFNSRYTQGSHYLPRKPPRRSLCHRWEAEVTALGRRPRKVTNESTQKMSSFPIPSSASPAPGSKGFPMYRLHSSTPTRIHGRVDPDNGAGTWRICVPSLDRRRRHNHSHWKPLQPWGVARSSVPKSTCPSTDQGREASLDRWSCGRNRRSGG